MSKWSHLPTRRMSLWGDTCSVAVGSRSECDWWSSDGLQNSVDEHPQQPDDEVPAEDGESILGRHAERVRALRAIAEERIVPTIAAAAIAALIWLCTKRPSGAALSTHAGAT